MNKTQSEAIIQMLIDIHADLKYMIVDGRDSKIKVRIEFEMPKTVLWGAV